MYTLYIYQELKDATHVPQGYFVQAHDALIWEFLNI